MRWPCLRHRPLRLHDERFSTIVPVSGATANVPQVHDNDRDNPAVHRLRGRFVDDSRTYEPVSGRGRVRHLALSALAARDRLFGRMAALRTPRVQVLLLHHIFDDEVDGFRRQLAALARDHEFITYSEAVRRILAGDHPRPAVTFSYDDGHANCMAAARTMEEFGASGCFFVCPSIVGERDVMRASDFCIGRLHHPPAPFMDWDDLAALRDRGHEIGNHTFNHANLGRIPPEAHAEEIARSRETIIARLGACEHFAWPYGGLVNMTPRAAAAVFDSGHRSCASALRGCHREPMPERGCLRRDHILGRWPASHVLWFMARNASAAPTVPADGWPSEWRSAALASSR